MDLIVEQEWTHVTKVEEGEETAIGPFNKWECVVFHPVELRHYTVDLKKLEGHWRMRVFWRNIRTGHRFMKALFPFGMDDPQEAQFLAMKHLNRYFEEQLAMYNAVCVLHLGRKFSDICTCDDKDHSQHLYSEQQPLKAYDGLGLRKKKTDILVEETGSMDPYSDPDLCAFCAGSVDIEAFIKHNLCTLCGVPLPTPEEIGCRKDVVLDAHQVHEEYVESKDKDKEA